MPEEVFETPQPVQIAEQKTTNWLKIILAAVLGLGLLFGAAYAGYWYGSESSKFKFQSSKPQPKTQNQINPTPTPAPLFEPTPTPTQPVTDPTAGWKTYTNNELSFKYPPNWAVDPWAAEASIIRGTNPDVYIHIATKDSTLMNECMKRDATEERGSLVIRRYSRVTTGAMCSTDDPNPREIWVIPTEDAYSPGINYGYSTEDSAEAENIFDQILATFKFLD